jgi:hypothetical protein
MKFPSVGFAIVPIAVALISITAPSALKAQSGVLSATLPFEFYVGDRKMPAGEYTVAPLPSGLGFRLSDATGKHSIFLSTIPVFVNSADRRNAFVFNRYGDRLFLSEMHWYGYSTGHGLRKSSLEVEVAKNTSLEKFVLAN